MATVAVGFRGHQHDQGLDLDRQLSVTCLSWDQLQMRRKLDMTSTYVWHKEFIRAKGSSANTTLQNWSTWGGGGGGVTPKSVSHSSLKILPTKRLLFRKELPLPLGRHHHFILRGKLEPLAGGQISHPGSGSSVGVVLNHLWLPGGGRRENLGGHIHYPNILRPPQGRTHN